MSMTSDSGQQLNAAFSVVPDGDGLAVVLESAGGKGPVAGRSRNSDYRTALQLLLARLGAANAVLRAALVDSHKVRELPPRDRNVFPGPFPLRACEDFAELRQQLTSGQGRIGQREGAPKAGNNSKRLRLEVWVPGYREVDAQKLEDYLAAAQERQADQPEPPRKPASRADITWPATKLLDAAVRGLNTHSAQGRPSLHKPLTLLWAIGRLVRHEPRLVTWPEFEREVGDLLVESGANRTPQYPFWHLASTPDLWETHGLTGVPKASDTHARAGFPERTATALTRNRLLRAKITAYLARTYLGANARAVLRRVGLGTADLDRPATATTRVEQTALRSLLLDGRDAAPCALCGADYPARSLVAAHVKFRTACEYVEALDLANVAMLACALGCDHLYEQGHLTVAPDGRVRVADTTYPAVRARLAELDGRHVPAHTPESRDYFEWHSTTVFKKPVGPVG
ncbi:hypothetical protein [Actinosynnema sp.]|uniref:hypothetical protein n=1 Tax=Actinosynnema sp. TaxID=1872144 RepID=UPI003F852536